MAKQQDPLRSIYNDLGLEQAGIGYDKFSTKFMADSNARRSVYNDLGLEQAGVDYDLFEERLGVKKKELSQSASQSGLGTSGQPSDPSPQIDSVGAETPVAEEPQNLAQVDTSAFVSLTPEEMQAYGYDEEGRTTWSEVGQSMANSIKNVGTRLKGFDERFRVLAGQGLERIIGEDAARQFAAHSALYNPQMSFLMFGNMPTVKLSVASAYEDLDRLSGEMLETQGLLENIRSGDPLGFLAGAVDAISALASTAIVSAPTAGAGLFVDMMGESIYEFNNQVAENRGVSAAQLYLDGEADYVVPAAIGLVGGSLEKIGFKGATNAVIGKMTGSMVRKAASMGLGANKEGMTEWMQAGLEAVNKAIANGEKDISALTNVMIDAMFSDEGLEAYLMGAVGTMGAAGVSRTAQYAVGKTNRDKANTSSENISSLSEELSNENLSPAAREAIQQEIERSTRDLAEAVSESAEILDNASPEVKAEVGDLMSRLEQMQAIIRDPSISESVKDSFAAQAEQLASEIDSLISESESELSERRARQEEVDQAILSFQEANPGIEVDYMSDLPDSVVTTFGRVESGLPTDPTAIDEASSWMYDKYQELTDLKNDPNRRLTIEQIEGIQEQLGEDITLLENYKLEQYGERAEITQVQPETTVDIIADQAVQEASEERGSEAVEQPEAAAEGITPETGEVVSQPPADAPTASPVVAEESSSQPGQYFTRDIGGEQTVYRRNEDGTATIVPDSEAQNILSQQTEQGQSIATERESLPVAESTAAPTEIAVAYAPLREHNVTTSEEDQSVRDTASYKAFESLVDESAKALGIPVNNRRNTWGGYVDSETGRPVQEVSNVMTITGTPEQARLLAAVIGQNAPEMQDSVLVGNYSPDGQGSEYVISVGSFENAQKNLPLLKENGIEYFTLDKDTGDIIILDLDGGLSDNINGLIEKLKENGDYTGLQAQRTNAEFIGQNDYGRIIEEARRNAGQQNWSDLDAAIERAKRSYAETTQEVTSPQEVNETPPQQEAAKEVKPPTVQPKAVQEAQDATTDRPIKPRTPKTLLKGISDKLAGTGLATSVKTATSAEITKNLGVNGENVNGYIDGDGAIVINYEKSTLDTPIHEFAHAWEQKVEKDNPSLHAKGMALIKSDDGKAYVDHVKKTQPGLKGDALYKEAMAQAIGDKGARIIGSQKKARIKDWLDAVWNYIADMVGISGMTADQISNLSLTEFTDAVAVDLLAGKPVNTLPNGDIVVATEAVSRAEMSESEKRVSDFIERMRNKNNIRFQGEIDSESDALSQSDLVEFMTVAGDLARLDRIKNLSDLKAFANSIGITNAGDINAAWSAAQDFVGNPRSTSAFKKADIRKEFAGAPFEKMSDAEYIEIGKRMVDEGFINPDALTTDIIENPRVLQTHETPAMTYGKRRLENRIAENRAALKKDPTNVDLRIEADALWSLMKDYDLATAITAYHWGKSGRLRDLTLDKEYTQVQALVEMEQYGEVSAEIRARLEDLGRQLNEAKADLINKAKEIEALKEAQGQAGINSTARSKPVNRPRTNREARQAAVEVLDGLDLSRFGVASPNFQTNGVVRFSVTANDRLSRALGAAVATMRAQVESGKVRIEEAVETAINAVNSEVGENGWSPVAFRSEIINAYSEKGYVAKPSKPYVGRDGKPVVPGEYLIGLVSAHRSETGADMTIDQMVEAAQTDLGPSFSERDIRDSISGYGRASANRLSDDRKNINTAKTIGRLQSRLEDLQSLGYSPNSRQARARQVTEEIKDLRKAIQDLIDSLEDSPDYKSQMSQALENKKKYIEEYIKEVERRIKTYQDANASGERVPEGYFSKTPKYDFTSDPDIIALERRREEARNKLKEEVFRHRLEHRGTLERAVDVTEQVLFNTTRMLTAGADLSAVLVQGGFITMSDPAMSYRAFKNSVSKAGNKDLYEAYYLDLQSKPLFEAARKAKLNMQLPSFYESIQEEQFGRQNPITHAWDYIMDKTFGKDSKAAKKAKDGFPYAAAERQYAMYLTEIRFEMFNKAVNDAINHFGIDVNSEVGQQKLRTIASGVNDLTMASNIRGLDPGSLPARIGNVLLFSMRKLAASWKLMLKMPYYAGAYTLNKGAKYAGAMGITNAARLKNQTDMSAFMFQKMYGKYGGTAMGSVAAITLIPTLIANGIYDPEDEEDEMPKMYNPNVLNPVHSDFMKLRWGNTRIDLTLGIGGNTVLVSRLISGGYMTSSSPVFREFDQSVSGFRNSGAWDIFTQYAKNKLAPTPSIAFNKVFGTDFEKAQAGDRITESLYPMWLSGTIEQYQDTGEIGSTIALFGLSMLGLANNTYGGVEFADHRGTDNAEARRIFERLLISDSTPTRRAKQMYSPSDEGTAQLQDSDFLGEYQGDYNEYMTQATITRKPIITNRRLHPEKVNSLVNNMKSRANKYAEIKNTGIYLDEDFRKVTNRKNETFKLTNAQISQKANILIRTMGSEKFQRFMPQLRKAAEKNMKADGLNPTKEMIEMEAVLSLYNSAHAEASRQMTLIVNKGNMTLVPEDEYNSRADVKGEYDE